MENQKPVFDINKLKQWIFPEWMIMCFLNILKIQTTLSLEKEFTTELEHRSKLSLVFKTEAERNLYINRIKEYRSILRQSIWLKQQHSNEKYREILYKLIDYLNNRTGRVEIIDLMRRYKFSEYDLKDFIDKMFVDAKIAEELIYNWGNRHECVKSIMVLADRNRRSMIQRIAEIIDWIPKNQDSELYQKSDFIFLCLGSMQAILLDDYDVLEVFKDLENNGIGPKKFLEFINVEYSSINLKYRLEKARNQG